MTPEELEAIRQRNADRLAEMQDSPLAGYRVTLTSFMHGQCYKDIGDLLAEVDRLRAALELGYRLVCDRKGESGIMPTEFLDAAQAALEQHQPLHLDGDRVQYQSDAAREQCERCKAGK